MAIMSRYCKAYPIDRLEAYTHWSKFAKQPAKNQEPQEPATATSGCLFVHEDLTVTAGVFKDEDIVFDSISPEWTEFCKSDLEFRVPYDELDEDTAPVEEGQKEPILSV